MEMHTASCSERLLLAIGRLDRQLDQDVHLLAQSGVAFDRMELRSYENEPGKRALAVDGNVVRIYSLTFEVGRSEPLVLDELDRQWTAHMPAHTKRLAEAVVEWSQHEMLHWGRVVAVTVN